jgi:ferric-dicitrate binding protein FerR (iron transport regulator)
MRLSNQDDLQIAEEAALWVVRLRREESHAVRAQFEEWCRSPRHMREYLRARATARRLEVLGRMPLGARRNPRTSNVLVFRPRNVRDAPGRPRTPLSAAKAFFTRMCDWVRARTGRRR